MHWTEHVTGFFDDITRTLVAIAGTVGPWLAPMAPAAIVQRALETRYSLQPWASWSAAGLIEALGIVSLDTALKLYSYNMALKGQQAIGKRKSDPFAPVPLAVFAIAIYVVSGLGFAFDLAGQYTIALLFFDAVAAYICLALREQHAARLRSIETGKAERKRQRETKRRLQPKATRQPMQPQRHYKYDAQALQILRKQSEITPTELATALGCNRGQAYKVLQRIRNDSDGNG